MSDAHEKLTATWLETLRDAVHRRWRRHVACRLGRHWFKWDGGRDHCVYCELPRHTCGPR